jgi:arsenate reductase
VVKRLGWSFADPSGFSGTAEDVLEETRKVRDQVKETVLSFIEQAKGLEFWVGKNQDEKVPG